MDRQGLIPDSPHISVNMQQQSQGGNTTENKQQTEDGTIQQIFKASRFLPNQLSKHNHPAVLFFHMLFRTLSLLVYILSSFFSSDLIFAILVIVFIAFDFWTVKNVSGRLLVGLRWWNDVKEDGKSTWIFESKPRELVNKTDSRMFWWSLYGYTLIWIIFFIIAIIRLHFMWCVIVAVAITLNVANVGGYTKCDRDAKKNIQGFMAKGLMNGLMSNFVR